MSKVLMLATVGEDIDAVLIGVRDYPVRKLVLLHPEKYEDQAREIAHKLEVLHIDVERILVSTDDMLMDTLHKVSELHAEGMGFTDVLINVSSGEKMQTCSALSAAFVNGIPAIGIDADAPFSLPVLKFSYSDLISDAKFRVLESLADMGGEAESLAELSEHSGVEKSLLSYHLRTTREGKGLEDMGLVHIDRGTFGRLTIKLTEMGRLMLVGRRNPTPTKAAEGP